MNILFLGDIVGSAGRDRAAQWIPKLQKQHHIDLTIVNGENLAGGIGITPKTAQEMFDAGVDVITTGNHIWKHAEIVDELKKRTTRVLRPANFPRRCPGKGDILVRTKKGKTVLVINLQGRTFMDAAVDSPFEAIDQILKKYRTQKPDAIFVDFHAEASAEKVTLMHYVSGRVSALVGTHTHIPTNDARITDLGTAYITDVGALHARDSSIGIEFEGALHRMLTQMPKSFVPATKGPFYLCAVVVTVDTKRSMPKETPYGAGFTSPAIAIKPIVHVIP